MSLLVDWMRRENVTHQKIILAEDVARSRIPCLFMYF
jgi:hypothetical protein